jgi:hypothetical protein
MHLLALKAQDEGKIEGGANSPDQGTIYLPGAGCIKTKLALTAVKK